MNRYPTKEELKKIKKWPEDHAGLMDFIHSIWEYAEWGWREKKFADAIEYNISTAGWSGNEDIISALGKNFIFWNLCWVQSRRGGHYIFHVKQIKEKKGGGKDYVETQSSSGYDTGEDSGTD